MSQITARGATGPLALQANGSFQTSTDANLATLVGTRWDLSDGREVIFVSTGSSTTASAGNLYQDAAIVPNHQGLAVTAVQAYSNNGNVPATLTVTLGATALTANQYQGGYALIDSGTGLGQTLRIAENPVALASATGVVITLEDGYVTADTTSTVCLLPPHGANVIISPTTQTGAIAGVAMYTIGTSSYGFLASKGVVGAISDAKVATVGQAISPSTTTAGAVTQGTSATAVTAVIGYANQTAVSAKARSVFLNV